MTKWGLLAVRQSENAFCVLSRSSLLTPHSTLPARTPQPQLLTFNLLRSCCEAHVLCFEWLGQLANLLAHHPISKCPTKSYIQLHSLSV